MSNDKRKFKPWVKPMFCSFLFTVLNLMVWLIFYDGKVTLGIILSCVCLILSGFMISNAFKLGLYEDDI